MVEEKLHVIIGAGALGLGVVRALTTRGVAVRLVSRSGHVDDVPSGVEIVRGDVTVTEDAVRACKNADVVYHCAGAPYGHWRETLPAVMEGVIAGASAAGAKLVYGDNLYAYGRTLTPLSEALPALATGANGQVRSQLAETLLAAHQQGKVRAAIGRASDFYGPHARNSKAGDVVFLRALQGKPAQLLGDPDALHTFTFIDDFAEALVLLGGHDEALGEVWHVPSAPALTSREFVGLVFEQLGKPPRFMVAPRFAVRLLGFVNPTLRAIREVLYQSEIPWIVDHSKFEKAFGTSPTPHASAISRTLDWYRSTIQQAVP